MKRVEWVEPYDNNHPSIVLTCSLSVEDAIKAQKNSAAFKEYVYESDERALEDFVTIHWAQIKENV
jgi:hypothetical protein